MKKRYLAIALGMVLFIATVAFAIDWTTANQATVAWDAITYQLDPGERVTYVVYLANAKTDPNKANPVEVAQTQATQQTVTLGTKGSYFVGVKSVIEIDDGAGNWSAASESAIGWSDDPQYAQGGAIFGLRFYPAPNVPTELRPVSG